MFCKTCSWVCTCNPEKWDAGCLQVLNSCKQLVCLGHKQEFSQQNAATFRRFQTHAFAGSLTHFFLDNGCHRIVSGQLYSCKTQGGYPVVQCLKATPLPGA